MKPQIYGIISSGLMAAGTLKSGAQITVDGTLDPAYGNPLATQTINTGFGNSTVGDGTSAGGSELDAAYAKVQGGYLYLFLSGNLEDNGNNINIFISDGRAGQNVLNAPPLNGNFINDMSLMNGSTFSPGFSATFGLDLSYFSGNIYGGPITLNSYDLINGVFGSGGYITPTSGIGNANFNGLLVGVNDRNVFGVNGNTGTAANAAAAAAVKTGFEFGIPLSLLGNPTGNIKVLADINGASDNYLSQQFLPGLAVGTGNLGAGGPYSAVPGSAGYAGFDFSSTPGEYFMVAVPEPSTVVAGAAGALLALGSVFVPRHRRGKTDCKVMKGAASWDPLASPRLPGRIATKGSSRALLGGAIAVRVLATAALAASASMANAVELTSTPQDLSTLFPPTQGANGIYAQSRDIGTSTYYNLVGGGTFYGTPGAPFEIPGVFVRQAGQIEMNPSAIVQGGTTRDAVLNVQLTGSGFTQVQIQGMTTAGDGGDPTTEWYIYAGANNWSNPIWETTALGTAIDLTVAYVPGMDLYFSTDALGNDINDNACFSNLTVQGVPEPSTAPAGAVGILLALGIVFVPRHRRGKISC